MSYIQNKLDELIDTYRKETGFTEYDARIIAERLVADYHNHIVEKCEHDIKLLKLIHKQELDSIALKSLEDFINWSEHRKSLQDTNAKE